MKRKVYEELNRKLEDLNYAMTKSKFLELVELLGNRIILEKYLVRNSKRYRYWNWCYYHNSHYFNYSSKNSNLEYTSNWRIYC